MDRENTREFGIVRHRSTAPAAPDSDLLAVEEPLEVRVAFRRRGTALEKTVSITMRTPGEDAELALGFLYTEGIVHDLASVEAIEAQPERGASVLVRLSGPVDFERLQRHFYTSSSCGVCGKTALESLRVNRLIAPDPCQFSEDLFLAMPSQARAHQTVFASTGGIHAAALFASDGTLVGLREDIGRHNALDKLIGAELLQGGKALRGSAVFVSGRAGFELIQKSVMSGIPALAAVGAPSSLAIELARDHQLTLVGFLRDNRFNVYSGFHRVPARTAAGTGSAQPYA